MSVNPNGPAKADLPRLRVEYVKDERLAWLGHLEVEPTIERSIRRSRLPFSIGNGYARRMRVQFSQALPSGASSAGEYYDLLLTEPVDEAEALSRLGQSTPTGLAPQRCAYVDGHLPALEAWLDRSRWELVLLCNDVSPEALRAALVTLSEQGTLTYLRSGKEKHVDLTRTLVGFEVGMSESGPAISLETRSDLRAALRPRALVEAALALAHVEGSRPLRTRRVGLWHENDDGSLVEAL